MTDNPLLGALLKSTGAVIDSRIVLPGQLFFALPGDNTDGAKYASQALEKGAILAVVPKDDETFAHNEKYWQVDDVLATMQQLARDYRRYLNVPVFAITGSNGKTTNKNLLAAALNTKYRVHSTAGNYNNHIGLPLTILNAPSETNFLLLEMGTNHFGEIKELCAIAEPDFGSILNIGKSHLEFLHSVDGVLKAKTELADYLHEHRGKLFLNNEEKSLIPLLEHPVSIIPLDRNHIPGADVRIEIVQSVPDIVLDIISKSDLKTIRLESTLWGSHNVLNLIHTVGVGSYFGLEMESMVDAVAQYIPQDNRSQIVDWEGHKVYLDAYNANPTSMAHSIRNFRAAHPKCGALILGDMGELGATAIEEHENILELVDELGFEQVWLVGEIFRKAGEGGYPHFAFCPEVSLVDKEAFKEIKPILIKGSRYMAMERLLDGVN